MSAQWQKASPFLACMSNLALSDFLYLLELQATCCGVQVLCILDSDAMHSFVHPRVIQQMFAAMSQQAKLTVTIANGSALISDDVLEAGLVLTAQGDSLSLVTMQAVLYILEGLQTDVILGMGFLQQYNPQISWIDSCIVMPCLTKKDGVCKSCTNCVGSTQSGLCGTSIIQCSNSVTCTGQIVVSTKQVADSIKINIVSVQAFVNLVRGDSESVMWCTLVRPVVNQVTGDSMVEAEYAQLCDECQDVFQEPGMPP